MNTEHKVPILELSCREASRLISESLDRELTRRERWSLRLHSLLCATCRRFAHQTKIIREALAHMPDAIRDKLSDSSPTLPVERRSQIKQLIADALRAESQT